MIDTAVLVDKYACMRKEKIDGESMVLQELSDSRWSEAGEPTFSVFLCRLGTGKEEV
jgi:hypothetical protein